MSADPAWTAQKVLRCSSRVGSPTTTLAPGTEGAAWWYESREDAVEGSDVAWICAPFARLGGDFAEGAVLRCPVSSCE